MKNERKNHVEAEDEGEKKKEHRTACVKGGREEKGSVIKRNGFAIHEKTGRHREERVKNTAARKTRSTPKQHDPIRKDWIVPNTA